MKELSIEEKARRYDEVIRESSKIIDFCAGGANISECVSVKATIEQIFPELKESEDKIIINALKSGFKLLESEYKLKGLGGIKFKKMLAWLEKQKTSEEILILKDQIESLHAAIKAVKETHRIELEKQAEHAKFCDSIHIGDKVTRNEDGVLVNLSQLDRVAKKQGKQNSTDKVEPKFKVGDTIRNKKYGFTGKIIAIDTEYRLSECCGTHLPFDWQDAYEIVEQKPTDKVEPKFKVGIWYQCVKDFFGKGVTFDKNTAYYCEKEGCLKNEYGCHIAIVKDLYDNFKLWTIQDAKDGDVLAYRDGQWIFIYKGIVTEDTFKYYALLSEKGITVNDAGFTLLDDAINPATKEQRDTLEKAMADAGYTFDFEKKELKKIEQKPVSLESAAKIFLEELSKTPYNNKPITDAQVITKELLKFLSDARSYNPNAINEQKPAWSEEDESLCMQIEGLLKVCLVKNLLSFDLYKKMCDLLKSLKDRLSLQPQQEWGEEDNRMIGFIEEAADNYWAHEKAEKIIAWLKSISPHKCSNDVPSREYILNIWCLENLWKEKTGGVCGTQIEYIQKHWKEGDYYEDLVPQSQWKPSEEQMRVLALSFAGVYREEDIKTLRTLYEDLKAL